ncbi:MULTISPECIES: MBL fold metallo-hydrolase [Salinibaculum]|uniref:MBL fold metallo-hydrolase n=1 Tax=Salinibaculum TaxID=2732368 RepID=UPI0030D340ED
MEVTLLGTGDTTGTPTVGCDCDTCAAARERGVERTRFSVHVRNERTDETLLVDLSPDFRQQFLREDLSVPDAAVVTHIHFDHLHGAGNVFRLTRSLPVHAAAEVDPTTGESVAETVARQYDYLDAIEVHDQEPLEPFTAAGLNCRLVPVDHPPLVCYGLAVEDPETGAKLSISGDTTYDVPEDSRDVLADPDLLVADGIVHAEFCERHPRGGQHHDADGVPRTFGTKHMTVDGARALAEDLNADRFRAVHVSHFVPADRAFEDPFAVDGERYRL